MKCLAQSKSSISMISFALAGQGQIIHDSSSTPGGQQNGLTLPVPQSAESRTGQAGRGEREVERESKQVSRSEKRARKWDSSRAGEQKRSSSLKSQSILIFTYKSHARR